MRAAQAAATSIFSRQLLKEDIARIEKLEALAGLHADAVPFRTAAMVLQWTPSDLRTFELNPELGAFIDSVYAHVRNGSVDAQGVDNAWTALHKRRIDLLVGCLSRPRID
jgi:hypothetical protein